MVTDILWNTEKKTPKTPQPIKNQKATGLINYLLKDCPFQFLTKTAETLLPVASKECGYEHLSAKC